MLVRAFVDRDPVMSGAPTESELETRVPVSEVTDHHLVVEHVN